MSEGVKEIKDLSDKIETTVDNNEITKAHEVLNDPAKKQQALEYLQKNEAQIADVIKDNLLRTAALQLRWDARASEHPGEENPYKGAVELYEKLFKTTVTAEADIVASSTERQGFIGPMPDVETAISNDAKVQEMKNKLQPIIGGKTMEQAVHDITTAKLDQAKEDSDITKQLKEHLKKGDYAAAFMDIVQMLFFHNNEISFKELAGTGFVKLSEDELKAIYEKGKDGNNPKVLELKEKIRTASSPNEKMAYAYLLTQIEDYIAEHNAGKALEDMDLLKPQLKKGSIVLMCQERQNPNALINIGNAGIMTKDNNTIADFTHASIVTEDGDNPMITHSTFKEGVHKQSLRDYLHTFPRTNIVVLNPQDPKLGENMAMTCDQHLGEKYDYSSGVAQFMADVSVDTKLGKQAKDDKTKTNCVEFIADALYNTSNNNELADKSHPNDLLAATKAGYSLDYVKTYRRDKLAAA